MARVFTITELAKRLTLRSTYPSETKFGARVHKQELEKRLVASYTALHFLQDGQEVFMADGTSALWTMVAIFVLDLDVAVKTNNLAVAHESIFWSGSKANVAMIQGQIDADKAAAYGENGTGCGESPNVSACVEAAKRADFTIMPVTELSYEAGPCAECPGSRIIKNRVMSEAPQVICLVDSTKLRPPKELTQGKVQRQFQANRTNPIFIGRDKQKWHAIREGLIIVCDRPAGLPSSPPQYWGPREVTNDNKAFADEVRLFVGDPSCDLHLVPSVE